jgi:enamine deaminase RidA (YjgF/YER057c/UK114 family)
MPPTFEDVKQVLTYLVGQNPNWQQIALRHRNQFTCSVDPHLFGWETEQQLLMAKARNLWLINPECRGNGKGHLTNLVRILTEDGLGVYPRMPLEGFGNQIEPGSAEIQTIIAWIDSLPSVSEENIKRLNSGPDARFLALGAELPPIPTIPSGFNFVQYKRVRDLLYLSGMGPQRGDSFDPKYIGKVGGNGNLTVELGIAAARLTALNLLHVVRKAIGTLDAVVEVVELFGMVNGTPEFKEFPKVINGCSDCLVEIFGQSGKHVRTAIGAALPFDIAVDINMTVRLFDCDD